MHQTPLDYDVWPQILYHTQSLRIAILSCSLKEISLDPSMVERKRSTVILSSLLHRASQRWPCSFSHPWGQRCLLACEERCRRIPRSLSFLRELSSWAGGWLSQKLTHWVALNDPSLKPDPLPPLLVVFSLPAKWPLAYKAEPSPPAASIVAISLDRETETIWTAFFWASYPSLIELIEPV
jgi:hypothetical protein